MYITNPTSSPYWSTSNHWEYLLIVSPEKEVYEKVVTEKEKFYYKYGEKIAIKTKPHITLAVFLARTEMEKALNISLQAICNVFRASTVTLDSYSGFKPNTIFLKVQNHEPFKRIAKALKAMNDFLDEYECPPIKVTSHPHMSIARRLREYVYFKAIREYKYEAFFESFTMNELVLIKRPHQLHECHNLGAFPLLPSLKPHAPTSFQLKLNL